MKKYIMALDAGTTGERCILFDEKGQVCKIVHKNLKNFFPKPGWVEQDPEEILNTQLEVARTALEQMGITAENIAAIGITNQRETTLVWDRKTGKPVYNAIVWQCRRTAEYCDSLKKQGLTEFIRQKTGLVIDAYFSATKLKWILDNVPGARVAAEAGELLFGTVESFLIWHLSGGKVHITDYSNASRTMLFNIHTLTFDKELTELFNIPENMLPTPVPSSGEYGLTDPAIFNRTIPITGAAGDQQCALFGQTCFQKGEAKNTYGTGCFLLMNTGDKPVFSKSGLVTTVAWGIDGHVNYALEGSVFSAGTAIQWLKDGLQILSSAGESEAAARAVEDTAGCYVVPAFTGLGAPYWDPYARGTIVGLTRGVNKNHIIRATLESIAFQVNDILKVLRSDTGLSVSSLRVDGGVSANDLLMQMQADIGQTTVKRASCRETTAQGAAYLAGLSVGYYESMDALSRNSAVEKEFRPAITATQAARKNAMWDRAVKICTDWAREG